jgi:drug/metabolite transporter (DMT)-like permease
VLLRQPLFLAAVALNLVGFLLHRVALRLVPLYLAQAGISASLAVAALLAVLTLHERLGPLDWLAVAAVTVGLVLLAGASGDIGAVDASGTFLTWLLAAIVAVAVGGYAVARSRSRVAATLLGFLAGLGFAGSGIAARILPGLTPAQLWDAPAAYALPVSGGLAFVLYSLALQRGSVTVATAPMIVMQTLTPATVGLAVLGDGVRDGWAAVGVVGFVLTLAGAIALARFERG